MIVRISPSNLKGTLCVPSSKSVAHRAFIAAACSDAPTLIKGNLIGDDVNATLVALVSLGAKARKTSDGLLITPIGDNLVKTVKINAGASGSTLRFILPLVASLGVSATIDGTKRLAERPIGELLDVLRKHGITADGDKLPLTVGGKLTGNQFTINASVSSQYVSGLLLALPNINGGTVETVGNIVSKDYLDITLSVMRDFGIDVYERDGIFTADGAYKSPREYIVESDWSSAGFFIVAGAKGDITLNGLNINSTQGDKAILNALKAFDAEITADKVVRIKSNKLNAFTFDVNDCPDTAPALAVLAAFSNGTSVLKNTERLKAKESDRAKETVKMLTAFDIKCVDKGNEIEITGGALHGCEIDLPDDHRIAMAAAIAASYAQGDTILHGAECVNKSYPSFFEDLKRVGGKVNVLTV